MKHILVFSILSTAMAGTSAMASAPESDTTPIRRASAPGCGALPALAPEMAAPCRPPIQVGRRLKPSARCYGKPGQSPAEYVWYTCD
jgi:hypothetical protein